MFIGCNKKNIIMAVSTEPFAINGHTVKEIDDFLPKCDWHTLIGKKLTTPKNTKDLKIAFICNWNDCCGISTYSSFLAKAIIPKVKELKVFSELSLLPQGIDEDYVDRCWERGKSMKPALDKILDFNPDFIIVQHEYGLFPKAPFFLQMLQAIEHIPYVVTMHSVYEHLDKTICTSAVKNIVVHSEEAKKILHKTGNNSDIHVIPHGCIATETTSELWNIFQTPYALVQFGFGFFYKGVDKVLDAIHFLKKNDPKFHDIFYCYLCSSNPHTNVVHTQYYDFLMNKIDELDLHDNAVIVKKFQTEQTINNYLRTAKIALFPYVSDPNNMVYGASGAIRVAMANNIAVIASDCHQFDDLEGVVPRPGSYKELAIEIDNIFSNNLYKTNLLNKSKKYLEENNWNITADRYLALFNS